MERPLSTKSRILALIQRSPGITVDGIASALQFAPMTVRQHLTTLERDGLVTSREQRGPTGRPHHGYRLTEAGEETFPKRYDALARGILEEASLLSPEEISGLTPSEKTSLLLKKLADRLAAPYRQLGEGRDLEGRVELAVETLRKDGGFAEWERKPHGYEIRDFNCVYRKVADAESSVCDWHTRYVSNIVGAPVRFEGPNEHCGACRWTVDD